MVENINLTKKRHIFSLILLISPIIGLYGISTSVFTLGDLSIFLLILCVVFDSFFKKNILICKELLPYFLYIFFHLIISLVIRQQYDIVDFFGSTMRYLMILIPVIFFSKSYFDVEYAIKTYRYICIVSTILVLVQVIGTSVFGVYVKGYLDISFFPINRLDLVTYGDTIPVNSVTLRPRSFFSEPAAVAVFSVGYLAIALFKERKIFLAFFISLGILLTVSSSGILMCIATWLMFFYFVAKERRKISVNTFLFVLFTVFFIIIFAIISVRSEFFQYFLYRFLHTNSTSNRFEAYGDLAYYFKDRFSYLLFGYGIGGINQKTYAAGFSKLIITLGIFGFSIFLAGSIRLLFRRKGWQRYLLIVFLGFQLGTEFLFGIMLLYYLPFIVCTSESSKSKECVLENAR